MTNARTAPRHTPDMSHLVRRAGEKPDPLTELVGEMDAALQQAAKPDSYRALAVVPAPDPSELPPRADKGCPACWYSLKDFLKEWFCKGGRHGFLWLRRCKIREPHMHQHCTRCGATWVAQPHSSARYL